MLPRNTGRHVALAFPLAVPFLALIVRGVTHYAREHGDWKLTVSPGPGTGHPETLAMSIRSLRNWSGDGVIGLISTEKDCELANQLGVPVVNLSGTLRNCDLPRVMVDQKAIGRLAADHLLEHGLRRFVYVGIRNVWYSELRRDGFAERIAKAGGSLEVYDAHSRTSPHSSWQSAIQEMSRCLEKIVPPVGIMAVDDHRARLLVDECERSGFAVPGQVAVIGSDNDEVVCEFCNPPLTSVSRSGYRVGYEAAALLDRLMVGEPPPEQDILIPPDGIVARESTDTTVVHDPQIAHIIRYIETHLSEPFGVERLLRLFPLSRRRLEKLFKANLGYTPYEYLCRVRVSRAKRLLGESETLSMAAVARACGFSNGRRFQKVFGRLEGKPPTAYRKDLSRLS